MGSIISKIFGVLNWGPKQVRILILGLDNAGKTTILYHLKSPGQELTSTIPTIGFNVETLHYKSIKFQVWDLGGQTSIRPYVFEPQDFFLDIASNLACSTFRYFSCGLFTTLARNSSKY